MQTALELLSEIESKRNQDSEIKSGALSNCIKGFNTANSHFRCSKVIIVSYQTEYDYDGLHRSVKLVQGFIDDQKALKYFDSYADLVTKRVLLDMSANSCQSWYFETIGPNYRPETKAITEHSKRLALRLEKVTSGNGFEWVDCEIAAITVDPQQPVGKALFSQIENAWTWNYYLSNFKGSEL